MIMCKQQYDCQYFVNLIGSPEAGKSSIISTLSGQQFREGTFHMVGRDVIFKRLSLKGKDVQLVIHDAFFGNQRYYQYHPPPHYFKNAHAILIVYDRTSDRAYEEVFLWIQEVQRHINPGTFIVVAGNKADLQCDPFFDSSSIKELCSSKNIQHFETSAKTGLNVEEVARAITLKLIQNPIKKHEEKSVNIKTPIINPPAKKCYK